MVRIVDAHLSSPTERDVSEVLGNGTVGPQVRTLRDLYSGLGSCTHSYVPATENGGPDARGLYPVVGPVRRTRPV